MYLFFEFEWYCVILECCCNVKGEVVIVFEVVVIIWIGIEKIISFYENEYGELNDVGFVNVLL